MSMDTEIIEGDKIICAFMELKFRWAEYPNSQLNRLEVDKGSYWEEAKYHSSWDWLMPVIEKIETSADDKTGHMEVTINENHCTVYQWDFKVIAKDYDGKSKINAVWRTIVKFLKWYNHQQLVTN